MKKVLLSGMLFASALVASAQTTFYTQKARRWNDSLIRPEMNTTKHRAVDSLMLNAIDSVTAHAGGGGGGGTWGSITGTLSAQTDLNTALGLKLTSASSLNATNLLSGTIPAARYGTAQIPVTAINASGTASSTTYLRGDGSWSTPAGGGGGGSQAMYFNVVDYGADTTGLTNSTSAIMAAQSAAAAVYGTVYFPRGKYKVANLVWKASTNWLGESQRSVIISPLNSAPLITKVDSGIIVGGNTGIDDRPTAFATFKNFTLVGGNGSTIAMDLRVLYWFNIEDVRITGFDTGMKFTASLTGRVARTTIALTSIGIYASNDITTGGDVAANLLKFEDVIISASIWGAFITHGSMAYFTHCDFEAVGAPSLPYTSGCIHAEHLGYTGEGTGVHLDNCWFEVDNGTCVDLHSADFPVVNEINFCHFIYSNTRGNVLYAGANNTVNVYSSNFKSLPGSSSLNATPNELDSLSVWVDGSGIVQATGCMSITNVKETNGGKYINLDVDNLLNGDGNGGTPYRDKVIADAPIYYNRLNGAGGTQTPTIGSANIVFSGVYSPQSIGVLKNDTSSFSMMSTMASTSTLALDLSAYTSVAIEFWAYCARFDAPGIAYGSGNIFVLSENPGGGFGAGAVSGNVGGYYPTWPITPKDGWYHYVFFVTNRAITQIMRNGKVIYTDAGSPPANTNNFSSAGFSALRYGMRMSEFAVYAGTIPSVANFKSHYLSRNN